MILAVTTVAYKHANANCTLAARRPPAFSHASRQRSPPPQRTKRWPAADGGDVARLCARGSRDDGDNAAAIGGGGGGDNDGGGGGGGGGNVRG